MLNFLSKITTRDFMALELSTALIALTFVLAFRSPDSDVFKVLLGGLLTTGFTSAVGYYFNSSKGSEDKSHTMSQLALNTTQGNLVTTTKTDSPDSTTTTKTEPGRSP